MYHVDYFSFHAVGEALEVAKELLESLPRVKPERFQKLYGFAGYFEWFEQGTVFSGGYFQQSEVFEGLFFQVSGALADLFYHRLFGLSGVERVSRIDVKVDVAQETVTVARQAKFFFPANGKYTAITNSDGGRTYYFGSRKSRSFIRVYDKIAERRARGVELDTGDNDVLTRIEVVLQPDSSHKGSLAKSFSNGALSLSDLFRSNPTADKLADFYGFDSGTAVPLQVNEHNKHDLDTFTDYLVETFIKRFDQLGVDDVLCMLSDKLDHLRR